MDDAFDADDLGEWAELLPALAPAAWAKLSEAERAALAGFPHTDLERLVE